MSLALIGGAAVFGLVLLGAIGTWWSLQASTDSAPRVSWVLTREGPVRFEGSRVLHIPWDDVVRVVVQVHHADLQLRSGSTVREHAMAQAHRDHTDDPLRVHEDHVEGLLADFVQQATLAIHDADNRARFPTFTQPEGPPAAILADLDRGKSREGYATDEEGSMFSRDLKTLVAGLDADQFAEELKLLSSCRQVADLEWLADNNGGWLTKGRRNPKIKLVKHGTGTFLVVKYDDGWSTTLSKAPFRGGRR